MSNPLDFSSSDDSDREEDEKKTEEPFQQQRHQITKPKVATKPSQNNTAVNLEPQPGIQTPIQNRYVFWFMHRGSHKGTGATSVDSFEQALIPVASFQTVEDFWRVYDHIVRAPSIQSSGQTTFHLFKNGIKPTWEDSNNSRGGAWTVRLPKGLAARFWEELLLAIVGEQFDVGNEICGAKLSVRFSEDVISLWNRNADNSEATEKIRDLMIRLMRIPQFIHMEYKRHELSLGDKPSSTWNDTTASSQGGSTAGVVQGNRGERHQMNYQGYPNNQGKGGYMGGGDRWSQGGGKGGGNMGTGKGGSNWNKTNAGEPAPVRDLNAKWR